MGLHTILIGYLFSSRLLLGYMALAMMEMEISSRMLERLPV